MAWTTPKTARFNDKLDAAFWNEQVVDNEEYLFSGKPMAIYGPVGGPALFNTCVMVSYGSPVYDNANIGSWDLGGVAVPIPGLWHFSATFNITEQNPIYPSSFSWNTPGMEMQVIESGKPIFFLLDTQAPGSSTDFLITSTFRCSGVWPVYNAGTRCRVRICGAANSTGQALFASARWLGPLP